MPPTTSERGRAAFLTTLLDEICSLGDGRIVSVSAIGWVPDIVYSTIGPKTMTTSAEIVELCRAEHILEEAFNLALSKLRAVWDQIKADRKQNLIALIRNHGLEDHFEPYMLRLSASDEEALLIRWDAADILFAQERQAVFGRAYIDEKGRTDLFSLGKFEEVLAILLNLLDRKADYERCAVLLAAGEHRYRYLDIVVSKCRTEYLGYLCALRDLQRDFLRAVRPELYGPGGTHRMGLEIDVEAHLQPFKTKFEALKNSISGSVRNSDVFERMLSFTKKHPRRGGAREITYVQNNNNYGPSVNIGGDASRFTVNQITGSISGVDMQSLAGELRTLREEIQRRAASTGELDSLVNVVQAEKAAQAGDGSTTVKRLASAGKWVLDIAKELGASVVAKLIEGQAGLS